MDFGSAEIAGTNKKVCFDCTSLDEEPYAVIDQDRRHNIGQVLRRLKLYEENDVGDMRDDSLLILMTYL